MHSCVRSLHWPCTRVLLPSQPSVVVLWSPSRSLRHLPAPGAQAPAWPRLTEPSRWTLCSVLSTATTVHGGRHCLRGSLSTGVTVHGGHCPRGSLSTASLSAGVTVHGGHCPRWRSLSAASLSAGVTVHGGHCPRPSLSAAVTVHGRHCPRPPLSAAVTVHGRHCPRQSGSTTLPCSPD